MCIFAEKCNILNDQHFSSWSTKKLCSNEILCTTRWPVMGIWWVHGVFNVFEHGVLGYSLGIGVRVSQKVCTHQFSPTEQFLFSVVVYKRPLSLTFAVGFKRNKWGPRTLDSSGLNQLFIIKLIVHQNQI